MSDYLVAKLSAIVFVALAGALALGVEVPDRDRTLFVLALLLLAALWEIIAELRSINRRMR